MFLANKYINLLNSIKVAYNSKLLTVSATYNKNLLSLLNLFISMGYIKSYTINKNKIHIVLYKEISRRNVKIVSTQSQKYYISYKKLFLFTKYDFNTTIVLHTNIGLITQSEAIKKKIGGQLLFIFFN